MSRRKCKIAYSISWKYTKPKYVKFLCPKCHKKFRVKTVLPKDGIYVREYGEGLYFELHTHCPKCEEYIPYSKKLN